MVKLRSQDPWIRRLQWPHPGWPEVSHPALIPQWVCVCVCVCARACVHAHAHVRMGGGEAPPWAGWVTESGFSLR